MGKNRLENLWGVSGFHLLSQPPGFFYLFWKFRALAPATSTAIRETLQAVDLADPAASIGPQQKIVGLLDEAVKEVGKFGRKPIDYIGQFVAKPGSEAMTIRPGTDRARQFGSFLEQSWIGDRVHMGPILDQTRCFYDMPRTLSDQHQFLDHLSIFESGSTRGIAHKLATMKNIVNDAFATLRGEPLEQPTSLVPRFWRDGLSVSSPAERESAFSLVQRELSRRMDQTLKEARDASAIAQRDFEYLSRGWDGIKDGCAMIDFIRFSRLGGE